MHLVEDESMDRFCAICGRQQEPGPCPVAPAFPGQEPAAQYRKLGYGGLILGIGLFGVAWSQGIVDMLYLMMALFFTLLGISSLVVARKHDSTAPERGGDPE